VPHFFAAREEMRHWNPELRQEESMEAFGLDGEAKELLVGLKGREIKEVYANPSQVALVFDDTMLDLQPSCLRVDPDHSTDEACFAAANFAHGHQEELPRTAPLATRITLTGLWIVRTRLCFAAVDANKSSWHRRLFGQHTNPAKREWVRHPDSGDDEDLAAQSHPVDAGIILDFGERAVAAFCPNNDYRFAIDEGDGPADLAGIRRRYDENYRFDEL